MLAGVREPRPQVTQKMSKEDKTLHNAAFLKRGTVEHTASIKVTKNQRKKQKKNNQKIETLSSIPSSCNSRTPTHMNPRQPRPLPATSTNNRPRLSVGIIRHVFFGSLWCTTKQNNAMATSALCHGRSEVSQTWPKLK